MSPARASLAVTGWLAAVAGAYAVLLPVESGQRSCGRAWELTVLRRAPVDPDHPLRTAAEQLAACREAALVPTVVGVVLLSVAVGLLLGASRVRRSAPGGARR